MVFQGRVEQGSPKKVAKAIESIFKDKELYEDLVKSGLEVAHKNFRYDTNMKAMFEIMKNSID